MLCLTLKCSKNSEYLSNGRMFCFLVFSIKTCNKEGDLNECFALKNWLHYYKPLKVHLEEIIMNEKVIHMCLKKNPLKLFFIKLTKYINSFMTIRKHLKTQSLNYTSFCYMTFLLITQI